MTDISTLHELAARLERATGPFDNWSDVASPHASVDDLNAWSRAIFGLEWTLEEQGVLRNALKGSLDAVAALQERLLPGWKVRSTTPCMGLGSQASAEIWCYSHWTVEESRRCAEAPTECLARLRAVIAALIAQAES